MKENLAKRLIFLSRVIVGILIIMTPVFMLKRETNNLRLDVEALSIISRIDSMQPDEFSNNLYNERLLLWLQGEHKDIYDSQIGLRQAIADWLLEKHLTTGDNLGSIKHSDMSNGFTLLSYELTDPERRLLSEIPGLEISIGQHLERFDILSKKRPLQIATKLANTLPDISNDPGLQEAQFNSISLVGDEAVLDFNTFGAFQGDRPQIRLTVHTQKVNAPALLTFTQENVSRAQAMIDTVKADRQRLDAIYVNIPLYLAIQIASERLISAYSTVNILGFSLARENLPWGVLVIMISLLGATAITLRTAQNHSLNIVSDVVSEDAFDIVLDSMIGRIAIWIFFPLFAIVASLPSSPLSEIQNILLIMSGLLILFLGLYCVFLSNKL